MNKKINIPGIPHAFFKWYCKQERYEELHGDLEEIFYENVNESGPKKARWRYCLDVIRCCQPYAWKKPKTQNSSIMMFKNYSKVSLRSLMKSPLSSFINLFGLSVAIGICILVYAFAQWTYGIDQFHKNKNEVYLVTSFVDRDGTVQQNGLTPRPLGEMLKEDFVHIKNVCRIEDNNVVLKHEDNVFHERIRYADPEFLEMFTFPLKWGTPHSLEDLNSIIFSEKMAIKYFGKENPIGRDILMIFDKNNSKRFKVTGVAAAFPKAHAIDFDFLINFENLRIVNPDYNMSDWSADINATLIQVDNPENLPAIEQRMEKYKTLQNEVQNDWAISSFAFEPLATLYERSGEIRSSISGSGFDSNFKAIIILSIIAIFMLALACFNYINIVIVSAAKRLKEIGVRKAIGATRRVVIIQFLTENILITSFALFMGVIFGTAVFIPWFEQLNHFSMGFNLMDKNLWIFLPSVLLFTGIASGIYPALYISKFQVVKILKGSVQFGKKNPLTKAFLGFQLILACILIVSAVMFTQNSTYLAHRSWGYDQEQALYARVPDQLAFEQLSAAISQNPNVLSVSGSKHHLGTSHTTTVLHMPDREYEVNQLSVDAHYFNTMGLQLKEGRAFKDRFESDKQAVVVNERLVKKMALGQPVGQVFEIDSTRYEVIGVVSDFHTYSFSNDVQPTIFKVADQEDHRYLSMKVMKGSEAETYQALLTHWAELFPEIPFDGGHQEDIWGSYFQEISNHARFWKGIAFIAVLLASLGLYGLVTLNVAGRIREFSIRKLLGARLENIASDILKQYIVLFAVALLIGAPVSYILVELLFDSVYTYHVPMNYSSVVLAVVILIFVLLTTVSVQVRKAAKSNPVEGLKVE